MAAEKVKNNAVIATHNQKKISIKVSLEYRDFILKNIINKMTGTIKAAIRLSRLIREIFSMLKKFWVELAMRLVKEVLSSSTSTVYIPAETYIEASRNPRVNTMANEKTRGKLLL